MNKLLDMEQALTTVEQDLIDLQRTKRSIEEDIVKEAIERGYLHLFKLDRQQLRRHAIAHRNH